MERPVVMTKKMKTTVVPFNQMQEEEEFKHKTKYYIVNAMGDHVYFHCRERKDAQLACDQEYGKGFYSVKTTSTEKGGGNISCRGFSNNKSMAGQRLVSITKNQGR